ncbi:MAG: hypothetical protein EBY29_10250 [Planctomycetes bacterium]|nr:hypothetical protein [Planctomycetota bacterium]
MSDLTDDTKLNCAGEFMMACNDASEMSQVVGALASLLDSASGQGRGAGSLEFIESFSEALVYSLAQAKELYPDIIAGEDKDHAQADCLEEILEFSRIYIAKAYEKKVGRA